MKTSVRSSAKEVAERAGCALAEVFRKAGFTHFRRAAQTPFNLTFEVRRDP